MAHNFQPANEVFRLFELVAAIVPHLDELSMVRVQRVNRTFREVVQGTRTLRKRLGLLDTIRAVTDPPDGAEQNPLINWFNFPDIEWPHTNEGPISSSRITILNLLPHAFRAARNSRSSIYNLSITHPPVTRVTFICYRSDYANVHTVATSLFKRDGVTIGFILRMWARTSSMMNLGLPIGIALPGSIAARMTENELGRFAGRNLHMAGHYGHPLVGFGEMPAWDVAYRNDVMNGAWGIYRSWFEMTIHDAPIWFNSTMGTQSKEVVRTFRRLKYLAMLPACYDLIQRPFFWPAFALPARHWSEQVRVSKDRSNFEAPFEVAYACGIVFKSEEVDLAGIRLPFLSSDI